MKKRKQFVLNWEEWTLLGIVMGSTLMVISALLLQLVDTPTELAEKRLDKIANDYYITYLYPRLLGKLDNDPEEALARYEESGAPATYLRQLLHYNDDKFLHEAQTFSEIGCNTNATGVRFFPVAPYGPRDYKIKYSWKCKTLETEGFQDKGDVSRKGD